MRLDKPLKNQRLLSFYVQMRIMEANPRWGYFRGYQFPEFGGICEIRPEFGGTRMALTDTEIRRSKPGAAPYKLSDGGGLICSSSRGGRLWRWKYRFDGKEKLMALGTYPKLR